MKEGMPRTVFGRHSDEVGGTLEDSQLSNIFFGSGLGNARRYVV